MRPRTERLEFVIATALLALHGQGQTSPTVSGLAQKIDQKPTNLYRALQRLIELHVITSHQTSGITSPRTVISLTPDGIRRTNWSKHLGARALIGVPNEDVLVLTVLYNAEAALTEEELPQPPAQDRLTINTVVTRLQREGFIADARDLYAPGSSQQSQWFITERGRLLLACFGGGTLATTAE